jgi:hypothetical protein
VLTSFFSFSDPVQAQVAEEEGESVVGHACCKHRVCITPPKLLHMIIYKIQASIFWEEAKRMKYKWKRECKKVKFVHIGDNVGNDYVAGILSF